MRLVADKISTLEFGWNERPLSDRDLYRLCERFGVRVTEEPIATTGFYYRLLGQDFIAINSKLSGIEKLFVLFHELGHFLLHVPQSGPAASFFEVGRTTRKEREADVFALCALMPSGILERRGIDGLIHDGYPPELVERRVQVHKRYRL
jgi:Zn-dependent peptidase ImmA (M78 family)